MNRFTRGWLAIALGALLAALAIGGASAHGGSSSPFQTFTQTIGPYEIGVTVELPPAAPAPLPLDITVPQNIGAATITLRAVPRGASLNGAPSVEIKTAAEAQQPVYYTQLNVDRLGDWDLEVQVEGANGGGQALIPFTLTAAPLPPYTIQLIIGLAVLVVLMVITLIVASIFSRRRAPIPTWLSWILGRSMLVAITVIAVFGILQVDFSVNDARAKANDATYLPAGTLISSIGRPHANLTLRPNPATPQANQPMTLALQLSDGGTGLPVDDLIPHHDALIHLIVMNQDGAFFLHTHPARLRPGYYSVDFTPTYAGRYTAYAEIERYDSGTQVVQGTFEVGGTSPAEPAPAPGLGERTINGVQVQVAASTGTVKANLQTTLTFSFRNADGPIRDLQPWLGMAGHLIARSDDQTILAHVHAAERLPPIARPVIVDGYTYGPDIRFVYTFPQTGTYQVWGQFRYHGQILTVPLTINVE